MSCRQSCFGSELVTFACILFASNIKPETEKSAASPPNRCKTVSHETLLRIELHCVQKQDNYISINDQSLSATAIKISSLMIHFTKGNEADRARNLIFTRSLVQQPATR